eukprot:PhM_4_TR17935/c0_g1_i1/m.13974
MVVDLHQQALHRREHAAERAVREHEVDLGDLDGRGLALKNVADEVALVLHLEGDARALVLDAAATPHLTRAVPTEVAREGHDDGLLEERDVAPVHLALAGAVAAVAVRGQLEHLLHLAVVDEALLLLRALRVVRRLRRQADAHALVVRASVVRAGEVLVAGRHGLDVAVPGGVVDLNVPDDVEVEAALDARDEGFDLRCGLGVVHPTRLLVLHQPVDDGAHDALHRVDCALLRLRRDLEVELGHGHDAVLRLHDLAVEVGAVGHLEVQVDAVGWELVAELDLAVGVAAVGALERRHDDATEVGDFGEEQARLAVVLARRAQALEDHHLTHLSLD